jgi:hypothetical protein
MKITFHLQDTALYNCTLHIRDARGARAYHMNTLTATGTPAVPTLTVEVTGDSVEIVTLPRLSPSLAEEAKSLKGDTMLETIALRALGKAACAFSKAGFLQNAITYRLPLRERIGTDVGGSDAIHLHLTERFFCPTPEWMTEVLDLYPLTYVFFELSERLSEGLSERLSEEDNPYTPATLRDLNRLELLRLTRKLILLQCAGETILLYPFLMSRIKRLSKSRVVLRRLKKLYRLPPEERAKLFDDWNNPLSGTEEQP